MTQQTFEVKSFAAYSFWNLLALVKRGKGRKRLESPCAHNPNLTAVGHIPKLSIFRHRFCLRLTSTSKHHLPLWNNSWGGPTDRWSLNWSATRAATDLPCHPFACVQQSLKFVSNNLREYLPQYSNLYSLYWFQILYQCSFIDKRVIEPSNAAMQMFILNRWTWIFQANETKILFWIVRDLLYFSIFLTFWSNSSISVKC